MPIQTRYLNSAIFQAQEAYEKAQENAIAHHRAYRDACARGDKDAAQKHAIAMKQAEHKALCEAHQVEVLKTLLEDGVAG